jgi:hypothetical protein
MSRLPCALAGLGALLGPLAASAGATVAPHCVERGPEARVCSQLDETALRRAGDSTTWRVWVEGTNAPLQVRLHNNAPSLFHVRGGDDQVIHLGCRIHRAVRRKVVALAPAPLAAAAPALTVAGETRRSAEAATPGEQPAQLEVRPYSTVPSQEAAAIAAALVHPLTQIEADFVRRRAELPAEPSAGAVKELLDVTERELLTALSYRELMPLRDYVVVQFRQARTRAATSRVAAREPWRLTRRAVLVAFAPQSGGSTGAVGSWADSALDIAHRCIRGLRVLSEADDLTTSLCVTSTPPGATMKMRLVAVRLWLTEKRTTGWYPQLYRGYYVYSVRKGLKTIRCLDPEREGCGPIDLVDSKEPVFQCDFESGVCERRNAASLPEGCHAGSP